MPCPHATDGEPPAIERAWRAASLCALRLDGHDAASHPMLMVGVCSVDNHPASPTTPLTFGANLSGCPVAIADPMPASAFTWSVRVQLTAADYYPSRAN